MNKMGISAVVATVLLLFLTIVAALSIYQFVVPFVKENLYKSTECLPYQNYFSFDESLGYSCYNSTLQRYLISVKAQQEKDKEGKVNGFNLVFIRTGESKSIGVRAQIPSREVSMLEGGNIIIPSEGDILTYMINPGIIYDSVEIYPSLSNGRVCEKMSGKIKLSTCR